MLVNYDNVIQVRDDTGGRVSQIKEALPLWMVVDIRWNKYVVAEGLFE